MTPSQNHYEVLGISEDASASEIEDAFYQKVREHPPEQDPGGHERIREAYDVLSNSREEYDRYRAHGGKVERLKNEAEQLLRQEEPDYEEAIKKLKKAVVLAPEIAILRNQLGQAYLHTGRFDDALEQFNEAVELDEKNPSYRLNRGQALRQLERLGKAEQVFRDVWEEDKGEYAAARALAGVLFDQGHADEALEVLDRAIWADDRLDFEDFFCYHDKLQIYVALGRTTVLEEELETIKSLPDTEDDRKFAAYMLFQTGQMLAEADAYSLAHDFMQAAVELDPENPQIRLGQSLVEQVEPIFQSATIHDLVKRATFVFYQRHVGGIGPEKAKAQIEEIKGNVLEAVRVDPPGAKIKGSVRLVRKQHPEIYRLGEEFFESILERPAAKEQIDDCPHCGQIIRFEKGISGEGECGNCKGKIEISGTKIQVSSPGIDIPSNPDIAPLQKAVTEDDVGEVKRLLEEGTDPDRFGWIEHPPLHIAVRKSLSTALTLLLQAGADPNLENDSGETPLHVAVRAGDASVVRALLEVGADPYRGDKYGRSPLHHAVSEGNAEAAEILLEVGADPNRRSIRSLFDFERVAEQKSESEDDGGQTPLHVAADAGAVSIAKKLLRSGANPNSRGEYDQRTPLHSAAVRGNDGIVEALLNGPNSADPNQVNKNGEVPLHGAVREGNREVISLLLKAGADPDVGPEDGLTPLLLAVSKNETEIVEKLLNAGADPNADGVNGWTPLQTAAREGEVGVSKILLKAGADPELDDQNGWTALHHAASGGHFAHREVVELLLAENASLDSRSDLGRTPLHVAAAEGCPNVLEILLDEGAELETTQDNGWSPLHHAARYGYTKTTQALLEAGADPDRTEDEGATPLHLAARYDQTDVAEMLLEAGADPQKTDRRDSTPLDLAKHWDQKGTTRLLRQHSSTCFVATVAYGCANHPHVEHLRDFRDGVLRSSVAGRMFISLYYCFGPLAARFLDKRERLKKAVRYLLKKLVDRLP